jgi:hypothetical protein
MSIAALTACGVVASTAVRPLSSAKSELATYRDTARAEYFSPGEFAAVVDSLNKRVDAKRERLVVSLGALGLAYVLGVADGIVGGVITKRRRLRIRVGLVPEEGALVEVSWPMVGRGWDLSARKCRALRTQE